MMVYQQMDRFLSSQRYSNTFLSMVFSLTKHGPHLDSQCSVPDTVLIFLYINCGDGGGGMITDFCHFRTSNLMPIIVNWMMFRSIIYYVY